MLFLGDPHQNLILLDAIPEIRSDFLHPAVADAFLASRLAGHEGLALGTLPHGIDTGTIIERSRPKAA